MPKHWIYFIALLLPAAFRTLMLNTKFIDWLWYHNYHNAWDTFNRLSVQPQFVTFMGVWTLPVFTFTIFMLWLREEPDRIPGRFVLLPLIYAPFSIIGDALQTREFHAENLYVYPLIVFIVGYLYVLAWLGLVWVLEKIRLVR